MTTIKFKLQVYNRSVISDSFLKNLFSSLDFVDYQLYNNMDPHLHAYGDGGHPIPTNSNVVFICDPREYGVSDLSYGGLTFPGGRGGGCAIYVYDDYTGNCRDQYKYYLRIIHELCHLFDKDSDKCEAWLASMETSLKSLAYNLAWKLCHGDGNRYPVQYIQDQFYTSLMDEVRMEIIAEGEPRVTFPLPYKGDE